MRAAVGAAVHTEPTGVQQNVAGLAADGLLGQLNVLCAARSRRDGGSVLWTMGQGGHALAALPRAAGMVDTGPLAYVQLPAADVDADAMAGLIDESHAVHRLAAADDGSATLVAVRENGDVVVLENCGEDSGRGARVARVFANDGQSTWGAAAHRAEDGRLLVAVSANSHAITLFAGGEHEGEHPALLVGQHEHNIPCVCFSPDVQYLASASIDQHVCVWRVPSNAGAPAPPPTPCARIRLDEWCWAVAWVTVPLPPAAHEPRADGASPPSLLQRLATRLTGAAAEDPAPADAPLLQPADADPAAPKLLATTRDKVYLLEWRGEALHCVCSLRPATSPAWVHVLRRWALLEWIPELCVAVVANTGTGDMHVLEVTEDALTSVYQYHGCPALGLTHTVAAASTGPVAQVCMEDEEMEEMRDRAR